MHPAGLQAPRLIRLTTRPGGQLRYVPGVPGEDLVDQRLIAHASLGRFPSEVAQHLRIETSRRAVSPSGGLPTGRMLQNLWTRGMKRDANGAPIPPSASPAAPAAAAGK